MSYKQSNKQDTLVSGTNIKTINSQSLLGSGNISISGATLADGDYGDITVSGSGTVMTIDNSTVTEAKMSLADNTTNDVSTTKHGFAPKAPNDATKFLDGTGAYDTVKDSDLSTSDITTNDVSTTKHGFVPKAPNDTTKFLRGDATWAVPTDPAGWTTIVKSANEDNTVSTSFVLDTDLRFSVVAGGHYMVHLLITYSSDNNSTDYRFRVGVDSGTMKGSGVVIFQTSAAAAGGPTLIAANSVANSTQFNAGTPNSDIDYLCFLDIKFSFYASANATFTYQFQNVAGGTGTSRTWKGSILKYKRID